ncbi:MAG: 50S ribosomal protein L32 [Candidatus Omnitrophica bacterium]|nr:50S ribosomal protein L32 [Candidatus Omnitrophota bacterium]
MPLPKRRHSRSRRDKRRGNDKLEAMNLSVCPQCSMPKQPHRVCRHCGYYKGRQVVQMATEKKEKK